MESEAVATVERELEKKALDWPKYAESLAIVDQESYDRAAFLLKDLAELEGKIKDHHAPVKKAAFDAHKAAVAAEKRLLEPIERARGIIVRTIIRWDEQQNRIRMELEAKAKEAAAKLSDDIVLEQAIAAEEMGASVEETNGILDMVVPLPVPQMAPTYQKLSGISTRNSWKAEVTDLRALCLAIGQGKCSENLVVPNLAGLNALARVEKSTLRVPGVRAVMDTGIAVRTK
jgi:hypothetical protein